MKINKILIWLFVFTILLGTLTVFAKDKLWYDAGTPSDTITTDISANLISTDKYIWNTTSYWKEGNCYYFDLHIGNTTNITWEDTRREIICTKKNLSYDEINRFELANVEWTLKQLGATQVQAPATTKVTDVKGEDIKAKVEKGAKVTTEDYLIS